MQTSIAAIYSGLTPEKHTTGVYARSTKDHPVMTHSKHAAKWCAVGWLYRFRPLDATLIENRVREVVGCRSVLIENDRLGYRFIEKLQSMGNEMIEIEGDVS